MEEQNNMVVPFSNGTDASYWHEDNCEQCEKYEMESETEEEAGCKLAYNIDLGFIAGEIPMWVAERIGCVVCESNPKYVRLTRCKENI